MSDEAPASKDGIIGSFENGKRFTIMVRRGIYKGKSYVDIRTYFTDPSGELRPTSRGVRVDHSLFPQLKKLINQVPAEELKEAE